MTLLRLKNKIYEEYMQYQGIKCFCLKNIPKITPSRVNLTLFMHFSGGELWSRSQKHAGFGAFDRFVISLK